MKILCEKWHVFCLLATLMALVPLSTANAIALTDEATEVPITKEWKITFSFPVIESSITDHSIYVMDSEKKEQPVKTSVKDDVVIVHAPEVGYKPNQTYTLHITTDVLGQVGKEVKTLKESIVKPFTIAEGYVVVNIDNNGISSPVSNHLTFDEANANLLDNQGIMQNDKYIKIPSDFVATNTLAVTEIFKEAIFTSQYQYTGVSTDTELIYVDSTEDYVKVDAFGQDMYVKHEDVTLIPAAAAKGKSYYEANRQGLWHHVYHHNRGQYDSPYLVGKKPEFLNKGVKYYSVDGANFTTVDGQVAGKGYVYFQYLSPRVPTTHSAADLDAYIDNQLATKEKIGGRYIDATTKSAIKGLGAILKSIEKEHRMNALFILALAIHESDYGMSCHAQNYNNLFGLTVPDHDAYCSTNVDTSSKKYYATIMENITSLVNQLNTYYLDPLNM